MDELNRHKISKLVGAFCENRVPPHIRNEIKILFKIRGNDVNIIESRPYWQDKSIWTEMPIAKIRYLPKSRLWSLLWIRANGKWQKYPDLEPCKDLSKIINEIDKDPLHVFWG
ncbi:DUF3024 domain-containing protein [Desulfobacterota bacterium M19]